MNLWIRFIHNSSKFSGSSHLFQVMQATLWSPRVPFIQKCFHGQDRLPAGSCHFSSQFFATSLAAWDPDVHKTQEPGQ